MFNAPIPGQSLTTEPKNYPWENPAEFSDPEEALMFHLREIDSPKKLKSIIALIALGLDIQTLTEGIVRNGVIQGRHTIDVSLLISPIIHEFILGIAKMAGIDYDEGIEDDDDDPEGLRDQISRKEASKILAQYEEECDVDLPETEVSSKPEESEEEPKEEEPKEEEPKEEKEKPKGLMSKGAM